MNAKDKKVFIRSLCNSVRDELLGKVCAMPEEWDGHELRELIADKFNHSRTSTMQGRNNKRLRDYRNTVYVSNL